MTDDQACALLAEHGGDEIAAIKAADAAATERAAQWMPIESAPYLEGVVIQAGGMTFSAMFHPGISEDQDGNSVDQWVAVVEGEHPPCWSGGACWASNEDEVQSLQPRAWRPAPPQAAIRNGATS